VPRSPPGRDLSRTLHRLRACRSSVPALLKYRNAHSSHIYIRPSGEHRFTTLDDLHETSLARLAADGFNPCAVVETSAGNFQVWLKHPRTFPKPLGTFAAQTLAKRYDADPSAADWRRFGRLPGFTNCKPKYRKPDGFFPFVRLHSHSGQQYGPPGIGKTLSAVRYSRADQIVPRDRWTSEIRDDRPVDTLLYTTSVVNTPSRVENDIKMARERVMSIVLDSLVIGTS
jgi:RepB DNA-primase N-terminal domain